MEKFAAVIEKIESQKLIKPPDNLVQQVMVGVKKVESGIMYKFNHFLFRPLEISSDAASILSCQIMSHRQCSFLLFMVGLLYLIVGLIVIVGLQGALSNENINFWLRIQPYITIVSAIFLIYMAFFVLRKPPAIIIAEYGIIAHTAFIAVNACVLESMLFSRQALVFTAVLTAAAAGLGVLLISSIRNFLKFGLLTGRSDFAQNI
jgi:membrane-associated HD superfamily phosphohydrolase